MRNPVKPADPVKREFVSVQNLEGMIWKSQKAKGRMDSHELSASQPELGRNFEETDEREFASVENLKGIADEVLAAARGDVLREDVLKEAREEAERLLKGCEGSCVSLMAALAIRISPDYTPRDEGGMRKTADRMADAKSWMAEERKRVARARAGMAKARTG